MIRDFRFAVRRLLKAPGFALSAATVLALGIGVNTAVFSLLHTLFYAPPPFSAPNELAQVFSQDKTNPKNYRGFSYPTFQDIRAGGSMFKDAMAFNLAIVGMGPKGDVHRKLNGIVSSNYFSVLGVSMARGRAFLPEEETPGRPAFVAVVSYAYWQKRSYDPGVLGSQLYINGHPFTVVGVAAEGFTGTMQLLSTEVWTPLSTYDLVANDEPENAQPFGGRTGQQLMVIGRFKPGITAILAKPGLEGFAANLEKAFPVEQRNQTFITSPISRFNVATEPADESGMGMFAPTLLGMSGIVLLVACLNLANMLLARAMTRRKEMAIRLAVGGSRKQIVRQLLAEAFLLALIGGSTGLFLGIWTSNLLAYSLSARLPFDLYWSNGINGPTLAATLGFCVLATIAFALGPALRLSRPAVAADLKEQGGADPARRRWKGVNPLVLIQISFSLALLTTAALFIHGAEKAASLDTGLKPGNSLIMEIDASLAGYDGPHAQDLYRALRTKLMESPGVERAAVAATVPFGIVNMSKNVRRSGVHPAPDAKPATAAEGLAFNAHWSGVSADYFQAMGLPIVRGRLFTEVEATQATGSQVAIIDTVLASKLWPGGDALGQFVEFAGSDAPTADSGSGSTGISTDLSSRAKRNEAIQIVGVVPAVHPSFFDDKPSGQIYSPLAQDFQSHAYFVIRFRSDSNEVNGATAAAVRNVVRNFDPTLPILSIRTFREHLDANLQLWILRVAAAMFSVFGVLALGLAIVGLYAVRAYSVARRTREIGIRMALGAEVSQVLGMFMREGLLTIAAGVALGLLLAAVAGKIVSGMLYEIGALDPLAFIAAPLILAAAALIATWLPARRATRVNPITALRIDG